MKRVIAAAKGGVGKSTISVNLAAVFASNGKKTLVIDLDPQCNSSRYLLGDAAKTISPNLYDYFESILSVNYTFFPVPAKPMSTYVHATSFENLFILPSSAKIVDLQDRLTSKLKMLKLRDALIELESEYDEIIIDTANSYNFFSMSAMIAADAALLPFDCDDFSRDALYATLGNIAEIRGDHNSSLRIEGIVVNQYQPRANLPQKLVDELINEGLPVLTTKLSQSIAIKESHQKGIPMIYMDKSHKLSQEFVSLHAELHAH